MNWRKRVFVAACIGLTLPSAMVVPVAAETSATKTDAPSMKAEDKDDDSKMSEADKRAKAIECSKQADAKKLHGEARKKFRSACKRGK